MEVWTSEGPHIIGFLTHALIWGLTFVHRILQDLLRRHHAQTITISLGNFDACTQKDVVLYGTHPMLPHLAAMNKKNGTKLRKPRAEVPPCYPIMCI